jgi:hypothetical protein
VILVTVLLVVVSDPVGGAIAGPTRPALRLTDRSPLTVRGDHFKKQERVILTVTWRADKVRHVVTALRGTFTARFTDVSLSRCAGASVVATGNRGSRAVLERPPPPLPACLPVRSPG